MRRCTDGNPKITSTHGQPTNMGVFKKHLGYDYGVPNGTPVKSPVAGRVTFSGWSASLGNWVELTSDKHVHRLAHLSKRSVNAGQQVGEGQGLGLSGATGIVTGPHCHHDVRKVGTTWNASFDNFVDWEKLLAKMPPVDSSIQLIPQDTRTTFRAGTTTVAGTIRVKDNSFVYTVRGYDPKFPGRIIINSASAGGDGVALALYYTDGKVIPGWRTV